MSFVKVVNLISGSTTTMPQYSYELLMRQTGANQRYQFISYCDEEGDDLEQTELLTQNQNQNAGTGAQCKSGREQLGTITTEPKETECQSNGGQGLAISGDGHGKPATGQGTGKSKQRATGKDEVKATGKRTTAAKRKR